MQQPLRYLTHNLEKYHPWVNAKHLLQKYVLGYLK